jgi:hypothetical protein
MSRSLTPTATGTTAPAFTTVSSSAGFNAGDLVYQKFGTVDVIPNNAATTGSFPITATVAITDTIDYGTVKSANYSSTSPELTTGGAQSRANCLAKLTNGNIVVVWRRVVSGCYFRIINEDNTEVVAPTLVTSNNAAGIYRNIGVMALSGGGFVVYATVGGYPAFAIYSNAGAVVTAYAADTTTNGFHTIGAPLPSGGFILTTTDTTAADIRFKIYSSTGVQVVAWTSVSAYAATYTPGHIAVRSDNTFCIVYKNSSSDLVIQRYNSAGASQSTNTVATSANLSSGTTNTYDCATLTNDTIVIVFSSNATTISYATLSAANSLSAVALLSSALYNNPCIKALSSGGFIVAATQSSYYYLKYGIYNSSAVLQGSIQDFTAFGFSQSSTSGNYVVYASMVETTNYIMVASSAGTTANSATSPCVSYFQLGVTSPYTVRVQNSTSYSPTAPTTAVSGYVKGSSTPNAAAFYSATTGTLTTTNAASTGSASTYLIAPSTISGPAQVCSCVHSTTMLNGDVVVAYSYNSAPRTTFFNVYSGSGTLKGIYTVGSSTDTNPPMVRVACLTNGKLVVAHSSASSTITFAVYSSAYAFLASGTNTQAQNSYAGSYGFSICAITKDRFAVGFTITGTGYAYLFAYNDAATNVSTANNSTVGYYVSIASSNTGQIYLSYYNSSSSNYSVNTYAESTTNSFNNIQNFNYGSLNATLIGNNPSAVSPLGSYGWWGYNNGSTVTQFVITEVGGGGGETALAISGSTVSTIATGATTISSRGTFVSFVTNETGATTRIIESYVAPNTGNISSTTLTLPSAPYTSGNGAFLSVSAGPDGQIYFAYLNASQYPVFGCFNLYATSYTISVVSGVTVSNNALVPSQSNGYIFKGVATTGATAGGTGIVQTNGPAQLSSSYSASTAYQTFDSTGTPIIGTKGTIIGRNINMTGGA